MLEVGLASTSVTTRSDLAPGAYVVSHAPARPLRSSFERAPGSGAVASCAGWSAWNSSVHVRERVARPRSTTTVRPDGSTATVRSRVSTPSSSGYMRAVRARPCRNPPSARTSAMSAVRFGGASAYTW